MKGVTIIIILSVVWSIVSGIIEKKKAAAKRVAKVVPQPRVATEWQADPVNVKIESLRRRKKSQQSVQVAPVAPAAPPKGQAMAPIKSLHVQDCPLTPVSTNIRNSVAPSRQLAAMLRNDRNIRTAIVLSEILSKPVSQRA
jgi:hypothetical protein